MDSQDAYTGRQLAILRFAQHFDLISNLHLVLREQQKINYPKSKVGAQGESTWRCRFPSRQCGEPEGHCALMMGYDGIIF